MLFSTKAILTILIPLMIEQVLSISVGIIDSMMVASAGEAVVSGVSLVDSVNLLIIYAFGALATGGSVVTSQFIGKKDRISARKSAKQLLYSTFTVSAVLTVFCLIFRTPILRLVFGELDFDVMKSAKEYFLFTSLSFPLLAIYNGCAALFRSMGKSKVTMRASLIINAVNICGNSLLIFVFKMGAAGAAIATMIARGVGASLLLYLLHDTHNVVYVDKIFRYKPDFAIIKRILQIGIPSGMENAMFQFGKVITQSLVASFGTISIAANAVCSPLSAMQYIGGMSAGLTLITVVGQCVGAGEMAQAKTYTKKLIGIAYAFNITVCTLMIIFADPLISLYGVSREASEIARNILICHSISVMVLHPFGFAISNAFRAANDVRFPLITSMASMWIFRIGFSYILAKGMGMGVYGVWIAMVIDWLFRFILYTVRFFKGTWMTKYKPIQQ